MSYFNQPNLPRTHWHCSLNLKEFFSNPVRGFFKENDEYVVNWYENRLSREDSRTTVEVTCINLTNPTYKDKQTGEIKQSFLVVKLPINYLHKTPFGSIWKNGESEEKFQLQEYTIQFSEKENLYYQTLWQNKENHPFEVDKYVQDTDIKRFKKDGNNLLVVTQNNKSYIIHPLHFFMAHYGYSSELKRILITYNWDKVEDKLRLNEKFQNNGVFLPRNLTVKDSVFLHYLKYDRNTKAIVSKVNAEILVAQENNKFYQIPTWHEQPITLSIYGIELGNSVLCCQITGISQPKGEPINLYYLSVIKNKLKDIPQEKGFNNPQYRTRKHNRDYQLEKLNISLSNVNNLVTADVVEYLKVLGKQREINKIALESQTIESGDVRVLSYDEPINFSVGDKQGKTGNTGIANCFFDTGENEVIDGKARLVKVWEHAKRLEQEQGCNVHWYTPKCKYSKDDDFRLISLEDVCQSLGESYPVGVLILRIDMRKRIFFVMSFPEKLGGSGFGSVVYEPKDVQRFLSMDFDTDSEDESLFKFLIEIISNGGVSSDYVDSKGSRMAMFRHVEAKKSKNNWVWNGIRKLL